jgi:hypothetical protein
MRPEKTAPSHLVRALAGYFDDQSAPADFWKLRVGVDTAHCFLM